MAYMECLGRKNHAIMWMAVRPRFRHNQHLFGKVWNYRWFEELRNFCKNYKNSCTASPLSHIRPLLLMVLDILPSVSVELLFHTTGRSHRSHIS